MQADPICKRLDRFLFSSEWDTFFSQSFQEALPRWTSDHSPIGLETNPLKWGPTPFRFENMWLLHPEFKEKFRVWWQECTGEGWEGHKFMRKLKVEGIDWVPISGESGVWLDRPFTEEEVRMAVFQLNKEKAPGPDGFTIAVYQECWDVIKEDLMRVFLEFHTNGGVYAKVLHETISGSQGAFVEGKHILDAVLIANEVVDEKRRSGEEGIVFKIDFVKAYDHVDWGFLDHGWVKASRGLRQGDPLSPFLFTLVADVLSLPLGGNPKTIGFWDPVIERISRRLDGWKKTYLSLGGRITLIQSCLSHILSYFLSLFKIPASIASKIEKMHKNFLWSGAGEGKKDHLVRWEGNGFGGSLEKGVVFGISSSWEGEHHDKLQLRRPYKSLCPQWCILCKGNGESIDHLFSCPVTIGLWNKLFKLAGLDWVPPRSFEDMLVIAFKGLGNSLRGKTLWQVACLTWLDSVARAKQ
ncbi:putative ribonuclease H protein [Vitis vinifera]|uniref:Putative ribonuclease H protein n=1 Tax=Vitis vinifera TaxID=29760 RepID=A0A438HSZ9_VITVI|nr:putative ribonuclease H protein [Vitis vinifera]